MGLCDAPAERGRALSNLGICGRACSSSIIFDVSNYVLPPIIRPDAIASRLMSYDESAQLLALNDGGKEHT